MAYFEFDYLGTGLEKTEAVMYANAESEKCVIIGNIYKTKASSFTGELYLPGVGTTIKPTMKEATSAMLDAATKWVAQMDLAPAPRAMDERK